MIDFTRWGNPSRKQPEPERDTYESIEGVWFDSETNKINEVDEVDEVGAASAFDVGDEVDKLIPEIPFPASGDNFVTISWNDMLDELKAHAIKKGKG